MLVRIQKWGNSLAVRIPKDIVLDLGLDYGTFVELRAVDGRLHVIPQQGPRYTLEELVAQITPENRHGEIDWGPPVGKEVWW